MISGRGLAKDYRRRRWALIPRLQIQALYPHDHRAHCPVRVSRNSVFFHRPVALLANRAMSNFVNGSNAIIDGSRCVGGASAFDGISIEVEDVGGATGVDEPGAAGLEGESRECGGVPMRESSFATDLCGVLACVSHEPRWWPKGSRSSMHCMRCSSNAPQPLATDRPSLPVSECSFMTAPIWGYCFRRSHCTV